MSDTKEKIIEIFKRHRQAPDAPYEEKHFLEFLFEPPIPNNKIRNSFRKLRPLNRFLQDIELEFGVVLNISEWEKNWDLPKLVEIVDKKRVKPKVQLNLAKQRIGYEHGYFAGLPLMIFLFFLLPFCGLLYVKGASLWSIAVVIVIVMGLLARLAYVLTRHYKAVRDKIAQSLAK